MKDVIKIVANILVYVFVFLASLYLPSDPDLGWHLKYGEYFFQHHQILRENIYSTVMQGYHWTNGSWGTDIVTYGIYHASGFLGLIIASAVIVTLTFFFFAKAAKLSLLEKAIFFPLLVFLESSVNNNSFRGQQISLLLLGVLFFLLSNYAQGKKRLWFVPLLFFFWSNLQTESFLGIALLAIWMIFSLVKTYLSEKKHFFQESILFGKIFLVTGFVTLINPFGWNIYVNAVAHLGDPLLKKISEYVPFVLFGKLWWSHVLVTGVMLVGIGYLRYKKKVVAYLPLWGIPLFLLLLTFDVRRYAWPAYYVTLPFVHLLYQPFEKYIKKYAVFGATLLILSSTAFVMQQKMPFTQFTMMSWETYCVMQSVPCSPESAAFLQKNHLTQHLFTYYDWGGYLIWNYPAVKPSIDGRMHVWRDAHGYSPAEEYDAYLTAQKSLDASSYDVMYLPIDRTMPLYRELSDLVNQKKWKIIYDDGRAGILVRIKKNSNN